MSLVSQVDPNLVDAVPPALKDAVALEMVYPECDGNPMSDNTKQFRWIVTIKENLEILFAAWAAVFIAGDLLWYPVEGDNKTCQAPDVMVVFGRPKGDRPGAGDRPRTDTLSTA